MAIGAQFAGLDMGNLIGGPLKAAGDANLTLAQSTANFINTVGFNADKSTRTALFKFEKSDADPLGNPVRNEMAMEVPLLAIVPVPNLQIDEVNVIFDMEVKECERAESSLDAQGSFSARVGFGPFRVTISGSVSSHQSNTRSTDNSAKYHVDVRAANHGTPEGLARVLDIMAACAAPTLITSKMVDGNGQEIDAAAKDKRAAVKLSYENQQRLGIACKAASESYETSITKLKAGIRSYSKSQSLKIQEKLNSLTESEDDTQRDNCTALMNKLNSLWERVSTDARAVVEAVYKEDKPDMTKYLDMEKVKDDISGLDKVTTDDVASITSVFNEAIGNYKSFKEQEDALAKERGNYNALLMKN